MLSSLQHFHDAKFCIKPSRGKSRFSSRVLVKTYFESSKTVFLKAVLEPQKFPWIERISRVHGGWCGVGISLLPLPLLSQWPSGLMTTTDAWFNHGPLCKPISLWSVLWKDLRFSSPLVNLQKPARICRHYPIFPLVRWPIQGSSMRNSLAINSPSTDRSWEMTAINT